MLSGGKLGMFWRLGEYRERNGTGVVDSFRMLAGQPPFPNRSNLFAFDVGNFGAPKTFHDPTHGGRRIIFGSTGAPAPCPGARWSGLQSLPRVVTLDGDGPGIKTFPLPELGQLRTATTNHTALTIPAHGTRKLPGSAMLDLELAIPVASAGGLNLTLTVLAGQGRGGAPVSLTASKAGGRLVPALEGVPFRLDASEETIQLRVVVDVVTVEAFAQGGRRASTAVYCPPSADDTGVELMNAGASELTVSWVAISELAAANASAPHVKTDDTAREWSGPRVEVTHGTAGIPSLLVNGVPTPAFWPLLMARGAGNASTPPTTGFDATVAAAAKAGTNLLTLCLSQDCCCPETAFHDPWYSKTRPLIPSVRAAFDRAVELNPKVMFIIRLYMQLPDRQYPNATCHISQAYGNQTNTHKPSPFEPLSGWGDLEDVTLLSMDGRRRQVMNADVGANSRQNSVSPAWAAEGRKRLSTLLTYLDEEYPHRIAGVFTTALHTSEWFYPYSLPANKSQSMYPDYSDAVSAAYCAQRGGKPFGSGCAPPLPGQRNTSAFGLHYADAESARFHLFLEDNIAAAIGDLANASKEVSGGKLLTMSFFGYNLRVMHQLQQRPEIDGLVSVYNYIDATRNFTGPVVPVGITDSMAQANKLLIMEDDTRTAVCVAENGGPQASGGKGCPETRLDIATSEDTVNAIRRNVLTLSLHGAGLYFGMNGATWFGNASMPAVTSELWGNVSAMGQAVLQAAASAPAGTVDRAAQTAVFLPDGSSQARTVERFLQHAAPDTDNYQNLELLLFQSGAPVRWYLLSQLPHLPEEVIKPLRLVILPCAAVMSERIVHAVRARLQRDNRTIAWSGAPGLLTATAANDFNLSRVADIVRMPGLVGSSSVANISTRLLPPTAMHVDDMRAVSRPPHWPQSLVALGPRPPAASSTPVPADEAAAPWFHVNESGANGAVVLGRFAGTKGDASYGRAAVAWYDHGEFRSFYSCSSTSSAFASVAGWRAVMKSAGAHLYLPSEKFLGDSVEARGSLLMVHAGPSTAQPTDPARVRHVKLPERALVSLLLEGGGPEGLPVCASACVSFETPAMRPGDTLLYKVAVASDMDTSPASTGARLKSDDVQAELSLLAAMDAARSTDKTDDASGFNHPGGWHTADDIRRVRSQVASGKEPWATAAKIFLSDPSLSSNYTPRPMTIVRRDSSWPPPHKANSSGDTEFSSDCVAAYYAMMKWIVTRNEKWTAAAERIIDAWSGQLQGFGGWDQMLAAGLYGGHLAQAAELLAHAKPDWPLKRRAQAMFRNVLHPVCGQICGRDSDGPPMPRPQACEMGHGANGNWDAVCMDGISSWAVFLSNHTMMEQVVEYYLHGIGNGRLTHYIQPTGQCQESGRDQGHSMMGEEHLLATALTVMHATNNSQLFTAHDHRLRTGFEYAARFNLGHDVPFEPNCDVWNVSCFTKISTIGRGEFSPTVTL